MEFGINKENQDKTTLITVVIWTICLAGIAIRLFHFFYNRSLWMDEVYLSSSFLHFSYADLATKALDHDQKAPLGFLWLVKLCVDLFGKNEMALRIVPLVSGLLSIYLFAKISHYFLSPMAQVLSLCIFAFSPALVYHSVEIKQYASECLGSLVALYLFIQYKDSTDWKSKIRWALYGAITLWFSYSVIFILAGIAAGLSLYDLIRKNWTLFFRNMLPFACWMISFGINYFLFTHRQAESQWVVYFFKTYDNFMPLPPQSMEQLKWFPRNFLSMMDYPLGLVWNLQQFGGGIIIKLLAIPVLPILLLVAGMAWLFSRDRRNFNALLLPVLLMLLASGLYLYPLLERFWVFIAPIFILFIGFGFDKLQHGIKIKSISLLVLLLVIIGPFVQSADSVLHARSFYKHKKSFERESLEYISTHLQAGDAVYNYWNNYPGFEVYKVISPLKFKAIEGRDIRKNVNSIKAYNAQLQQDFMQFKGKKRVWLLYNTQFQTDIGDYADEPFWYYKNQLSPIQNLLKQFQYIGKPIRKIVYPDVTLQLYELNKAN